MFALCAIFYLSIYALEAPIRYALYLEGRDNLILARDALMIGPLVLSAAAQAARLKPHPILLVSGLALAFHGLVLMGTIGSVSGVAYGAKVLMNLLFGFFVAGLLVAPEGGTRRILIALWLVILLGLVLDKFVLTFPWTGIKTIVGDLSVDVSKDWQIQDPLSRRVAGFTRSSIAAAAIIPCLSIILTCQTRRIWLRCLISTISLGAVFMTTQKGALLALFPVAAILCAPMPVNRLRLLRIAMVVFLVLMVSLPIACLGLHIDHGAGVFSAESIYLRIAYTWPDALHWIDRHQMLLFGVGLGGIGGPQRLYAPDNFNPTDNMAILLYAYFGVFAAFYLAIVCLRALRPVTGSRDRMEPAVAIVAFAFGYGAVLSVIEDQSASLFLGAAIGVLWRETRAGTSNPWPLAQAFVS